jgi:hypothetical protein
MLSAYHFSPPPIRCRHVPIYPSPLACRRVQSPWSVPHMELECWIRQKVPNYFDYVAIYHVLWTRSLAIENFNLVLLKFRSMCELVDID